MQSWPQEKRELVRRVRQLERQVQEEAAARNEAFSRMLQEQQARQAATSHALQVGASMSYYQQQQVRPACIR